MSYRIQFHPINKSILLFANSSRYICYSLIFSFAILLFSGCNPARRIPDGYYLLNKNKYVLEDKQEVNLYEVSAITTHIPNKRLFDIYRFNLRTYVLFDTKKEHKFNRWVKKHIGEAPVILDTIAVNGTLKQIKLYLFNHGYFNAEVYKEIVIKQKKANVIYHIRANEPYHIKQLTQSITDDDIFKIFTQDSAQSFLKQGDQYQSKMMTQERERITEQLNRKGYYRFSKEFITFSIDTNLNCNCININTIIQDPILPKKAANDSISYGKHYPYRIRNIVINPNFNPLQPNEYCSDSLRCSIEPTLGGNIIFIHNDDLAYSSRVMINYLSFKPGDLYNLNKVNRTYTRLNELKNFSYINISFIEVADSMAESDTLKYIDCKIQLMPTDKYSFAAEAKGTNTGGNFGVALDFTTTSRNIFRGGENLSLKLGAAYEAQALVTNASDNLFNTFEFSANLKLDVPRFYFPIKNKFLSETFRPKTFINIGGNYQQNPDYNRFISIAYFGYEWNQGKKIKHLFSPLDINIVKINPTERFSEVLSGFNRIRREQYTDHILVAMKYNFIYDNQNRIKGNNFIFFRIGVESVGNILNMAMKLSNAEQNSSDQYTIGGIPYANYLLTDFDFRYYHQFTRKSRLAYRTAFGVGIPFTNSYSLPFEKSFYLGGANSMRGWKMRSLGPGSYSGEQTFESIGDIKFETNLEYRFPIWDYFRGALFADAGNIWLLRENKTLPNGEFNFGKFYNQLALDAGFGIRLDFDYFLIRFDAAIPLVDPATSFNSDISKNISLSKGILNFGIGYPF
jgi:outer membrane protein assembly factor BamA